jgi:DNA-binding transcriptional MerR regulator
MAKSRKRDYMTIGEVIKMLAQEFPGLSISKVRYLEEEGLLKPKRTTGGYRKFSQKDADRLRIILRLQKDDYLPLNVIKQKLDQMDRGDEVNIEPAVKPISTEEIFAPQTDITYFSIEETAKRTGVTVEELKGLESFGLLEPKETEDGKVFDEHDIELINIVRKMAKYGIEPRHLRLYQHFADRETSFFEQILIPIVRQDRAGTSGRSTEVLSELINLSDSLKKLLLRKAILEYFQSL